MEQRRDVDAVDVGARVARGRAPHHDLPAAEIRLAVRVIAAAALRARRSLPLVVLVEGDDDRAVPGVAPHFGAHDLVDQRADHGIAALDQRR